MKVSLQGFSHYINCANEVEYKIVQMLKNHAFRLHIPISIIFILYTLSIYKHAFKVQL